MSFLNKAKNFTSQLEKSKSSMEQKRPTPPSLPMNSKKVMPPSLKKDIPVPPSLKKDLPKPPSLKNEKKEIVIDNLDEVKIPTPLIKQKNPFKIEKEEQPEIVIENIEELKQENDTKSLEKKDSEINTISEITQNDGDIENEKNVENKEDTKQKVQEETKTTKETKKKSSKKSTTKKKTVIEKTEKSVTIEEGNIDIPKTTISFSDAIGAISSGFVDEEWEALKKDTTERLENITISNDMTSLSIRVTISELSSLRESVWSIYHDHKTLFETLTAKEPAGLIERVKILGSTGSNAEERKQNGLIAVMNYTDPKNNTINLFELLDETRSRFNYLKALIDSIQYKTNILVTMLGSLKLEK